MSHSTRVGFLAGATALTLTGVSVGAAAPEPATHDDSAQRIAALEAKVAAMEASQNQNWLTEERTAEIKGLVQDVLADADTRASLLQAGMTSGYDNGFILSSTDGNWLLKTNFYMQQRFIYNNTDSPTGGASAPAEDDENRWGFENTRSKFILSGHVVNPDWYYLININVGSNGGTTSFPYNQTGSREGTGDAYLGYNYGNGLKMQMGSMKLPFMREELVDAARQLAVERSVFNYDFSLGYSDALQVEYKADQLGLWGAFSDGANQGQTPWINGPTPLGGGPGTGHAEYAFTGRVEWVASGTWEQFQDFTSPRGEEMGILVGGAAHYQKGEYGTVTDGSPEQEFFAFTVDASVEFGGANLFAALVYTDVDNGPGTPDFNPWGFIVQGGLYLDETWEIYGRFEWEDYDTAAADDLALLTFGVNKYFHGHNAKWTTDFGWGINPVYSASPITGWRPDSVVGVTENEDEIVLRTQWQIMF